MHLGEFTITTHALQRALDMGVDGAEIRTCLLHPESVQTSHKHGGQNYRAGRISCGVRDGFVVTVVWSDAEGWRKDLQEVGAYSGREFRG